MQFLATSWLPILVSAALVFIASSIIHMLLPYHKSEFRGLPDEAGLMAALRAAGLTRGEYSFPRAQSMKDMGSPEMLAKYRQGPVGMLTILPDGPSSTGSSTRC